MEIKFVKSAKCGKGRIEKIKKGSRHVGSMKVLKQESKGNWKLERD